VMHPFECHVESDVFIQLIKSKTTTSEDICRVVGQTGQSSLCHTLSVVISTKCSPSDDRVM